MRFFTACLLFSLSSAVQVLEESSASLHNLEDELSPLEDDFSEDDFSFLAEKNALLRKLALEQDSAPRSAGRSLRRLQVLAPPSTAAPPVGGSPTDPVLPKPKCQREMERMIVKMKKDLVKQDVRYPKRVQKLQWKIDKAGKKMEQVQQFVQSCADYGPDGWFKTRQCLGSSVRSLKFGRRGKPANEAKVCKNAAARRLAITDAKSMESKRERLEITLASTSRALQHLANTDFEYPICNVLAIEYDKLCDEFIEKRDDFDAKRAEMRKTLNQKKCENAKVKYINGQCRRSYKLSDPEGAMKRLTCTGEMVMTLMGFNYWAKAGRNP